MYLTVKRSIRKDLLLCPTLVVGWKGTGVLSSHSQAQGKGEVPPRPFAQIAEGQSGARPRPRPSPRPRPKRAWGPFSPGCFLEELGLVGLLWTQLWPLSLPTLSPRVILGYLQAFGSQGCPKALPGMPASPSRPQLSLAGVPAAPSHLSPALISSMPPQCLSPESRPRVEESGVSCGTQVS